MLDSPAALPARKPHVAAVRPPSPVFRFIPPLSPVPERRTPTPPPATLPPATMAPPATATATAAGALRRAPSSGTLWQQGQSGLAARRARSIGVPLPASDGAGDSDSAPSGSAQNRTSVLYLRCGLCVARAA